MPIDVTNIVEPARNALAPIGSSLSDAWSAVIGDRIAAWRLKNAAALQLVVNTEVNKLGLKLDRSKIPERYAFAWFEEATKQDEPETRSCSPGCWLGLLPAMKTPRIAGTLKF